MNTHLQMSLNQLKEERERYKLLWEAACEGASAIIAELEAENKRLSEALRELNKLMKAILEFNLPEDNTEYLMAINGGKYFCTLEEVSQLIRHKRKHCELTSQEERLLDELAELINEE